MESNPYRLAGWLAVAQVVLFPVGMIMAFAQELIGREMFGRHLVTIGPGDVVLWVSAICAIYCLLKLKSLLHERYDFYQADLLITLAIWWTIIFHVVGLFIGVAEMFLSRAPEEVIKIIEGGYLATAMVTVGAIDIILGVLLLRIQGADNGLMRAYAILTLIMGICEITVIGAILSLLLMPVSLILLAMIFFRDEQTPEFV